MSRPISLVFSLVLAGVALAASAPARACKCMLPTVETAREDASALFEGRVLEIAEVGDDASATNGELKVALAVVRTWKGLDRNERVDVFTNGSSAACGYMFAKGVSYLVYAREQEGRVSVSSCSRTRPLAEAGEDLRFLGAGSTPVAIGKAKSDDGGTAPEASVAQDAAKSAGAPAKARSGCALHAGSSAGLHPLGLAAFALILRRRRPASDTRALPRALRRLKRS